MRGSGAATWMEYSYGTVSQYRHPAGRRSESRVKGEFFKCEARYNSNIGVAIIPLFKAGLDHCPGDKVLLEKKSSTQDEPLHISPNVSFAPNVRAAGRLVLALLGTVTVFLSLSP